MKVVVKEVSEDKYVIEVHTRSGARELVILKTSYGYKHDDFSEWDIGDSEFGDLDEFVNTFTNRYSYLDIVYDL